jgi:octaheme c-type cytochrome (tetrathionate reductase family)
MPAGLCDNPPVYPDKHLFCRSAVVILFVLSALGGARASTPPSRPQAVTPGAATADHSKFEILRRDFASGPEVTAACLTCHTEAAKQIMKTSHWTWICPRAKKELYEREHIAVGKAEHIINNFCIALPSNEPRCTSCHAGYGWQDRSFDFTDETLVDCLVCHEQTGTYKKFPTAAGHVIYDSTPVSRREWPKGSGNFWEPVNLSEAAQSVASPTRRNCGSCHFFGGGGEGVKHGDMDVTLEGPDRELDVHMAEEGVNFQCVQCHTTKEHKVAGRCFEIPAYDKREYVLRGIETNLLACESCHTSKPHRNPDAGLFKNGKLNDHSDKVSCQACHIPSMAPRRATVTWWDWSMAGDKSRKPEEIPGTGRTDYDFRKGEFIWVKNAVPEYVWFNGEVRHTFMGDTIDDSTPHRENCAQPHGDYDKLDPDRAAVSINRVQTGYDDPRARIWPTKIMRGIQPYDPVNKTLVVPKLFPGAGDDKGDAYWKTFDWGRSISAGMAYAGLPYSGEFGWIQTEMIWPLKHMVAPKEKALACTECHSRDGRLRQLSGFYMPGRDRSRFVDAIGILMVFGGVVVSLGHGVARIALRGRR